MRLHWAGSQRWSSVPTGRREFLRELGLVGAAALLYFLVRGAVQDRVAEAFARARALLELEQTLGLAWELAVHEAALSANLVVDLANAVYFWGHMPLLIVLALWLWFRDRATWRWLRAALVVSALLGIVCYVVWPTAPPRLMPELGYIDTLASRAAASYQAQEVGPFVNPYAALPSLHVGWALLAGVACLACRDLASRCASGGLAAVRGPAAGVAIVGGRRDRQSLGARRGGGRRRGRTCSAGRPSCSAAAA